MTRRQRRATFIGLGVGILCVAVFLVLFALRDAVVGFHLPKEVMEKQIPQGQRIRLGGLVAAGSLKRDGLTVEFGITDTAATIPARYTGVLPDLFREGQGVVAEGNLDASGRFIADTVLAKHDENYMPPEVANALKQQGMWKHTGPQSPSSSATPTSPQTPTVRGEGPAEGQQHTPTSAPLAAPHPKALPASGKSASGSATP